MIALELCVACSQMSCVVWQLNARVPAGRCLFIPCSVSAKDQAAIVFQHFGVKVTEADIFSRCQVMYKEPSSLQHNYLTVV